MSSHDNPRKPETNVNDQFVSRWSPRSFDANQSVEPSQLQSLFEAAKWAPSCFNEQPWRFFAAAKPSAKFEAFLQALVEKNQGWAKNSGALVFVACTQTFKRNDKPNAWAEFDTGAAWMSLALQAQSMGLHVHAMAGFDADKAKAVLGGDVDQLKLIAAVAVGKKSEPSVGEYASEAPNDRFSLAEFCKIYE
ncbi:MAG: nitroreductase family protein [Bdellovibrionales bacterium]|nr:nitroreductase family protein [Bdellovibrionales bacterium]